MIDETSLTKIGRRLMARMLTRPSTITPVDFTIPTVLRDISENAIVVIDNRKLEHLVMAVEAAVDGGYIKKFAVILLLDSSVAADNKELLRFNVRMRALWRAGIVVIKPWTMPMFSCITFTTGARQFVVHDAAVTMSWALGL